MPGDKFSFYFCQPNSTAQVMVCIVFFDLQLKSLNVLDWQQHFNLFSWLFMELLGQLPYNDWDKIKYRPAFIFLGILLKISKGLTSSPKPSWMRWKLWDVELPWSDFECFIPTLCRALAPACTSHALVLNKMINYFSVALGPVGQCVINAAAR